jgi:pimeloyl-ACP methyl ester carboxylesterase
VGNSVDIDWGPRRIRIEYQEITAQSTTAPLIIFFHEGLGSVSMWRNFPARICEALQCRGLVYSRPGYGRSTPRPTDEVWLPDFMHRQAHEVFPALVKALGIDLKAQDTYLLGHSDGGSIALLVAAASTDQFAGAIVLAPHYFVETKAIDSIALAKHSYLNTDLPTRLARHHDDPDSAFWGWNTVWLSSAFKGWSIDQEIGKINCRLLAIQGVDDEYGTLEQIRGIQRLKPNCELLELEQCRHSAHLDKPFEVIQAIQTFVEK